MVGFKKCILGTAAIVATLGLAASAQATTVTLTPVYPGTISGTTTYTTNEKLVYKFTIAAPYHFTFSAIGSGGSFPFPVPISAAGTAGAYTETFGPIPVHGTVNYTLTTAVPEPATWALMLVGVGAAGATLRRSRRQQVTA